MWTDAYRDKFYPPISNSSWKAALVDRGSQFMWGEPYPPNKFIEGIWLYIKINAVIKQTYAGTEV